MNRRGFTLTELLVVIFLIGILTALLLPVGQTALSKSRMTRVRADISKIELAAEAYKTTHGVYAFETGVNNVPVDKLDEFMKFPAKQLSATNVFLDPWGQAYLYERGGLNHPSFVDIASGGPDQNAGFWRLDWNVHGGADVDLNNDDNINNWSEKR